MKKDDYERVGYAIFIIGILCVAGAGVAETSAFYDLPLIISGVALLVVGAVFLWRSKREERTSVPPPPPYLAPPP